MRSQRRSVLWRRTALLLGAGAVTVVGLWQARGPLPPAAQRRPGAPRLVPAPRVLAPIRASSVPTSKRASRRAATPTSLGPTAVPPLSARRVAASFLRAFAALLYRRGDPEGLPDASSAVREQANGAPDLADHGPPPAYRMRGPWPETGALPAQGDVRLHAEVADATQVLEVDLELAPAPGARNHWTVVGLGW